MSRIRRKISHEENKPRVREKPPKSCLKHAFFKSNIKYSQNLQFKNLRTMVLL
jgi:hypothetical protein